VRTYSSRDGRVDSVTSRSTEVSLQVTEKRSPHPPRYLKVFCPLQINFRGLGNMSFGGGGPNGARLV